MPKNETVQPSQENGAELPTRLTRTLTVFNDVHHEQKLEFSEKQQRSAIALATMINNPKDIPALAKYWQTNQGSVYDYINHAYEDETVKTVGTTIFERQKEKEKGGNKFEKERDMLCDKIIQGDTTPNRVLELQSDVIHFLTSFVNKQPKTIRTRMVLRALQGKTQQEIAAEFGRKESSVKKYVSHYRFHILDPELSEIGVIRISEKNDPVIGVAAHHGNLSSFLILGRLYTTPSFITDYEQRRRYVDPTFIDQGHILLDSLSSAEYVAICRSQEYSSRIVKHKNRLYISTSDLETIRQMRKTVPNRRSEITREAQTRNEASKQWYRRRKQKEK